MILPQNEVGTPATVAIGISFTAWSASPVTFTDSSDCSMTRTSHLLAPPSMREPC
jgi:hypothetical protein